MFPLFETLILQTEHQSNVLSYDERILLMNDIKDLDKQQHEYIAAIIRLYQLEYDKDRYDNIPPYRAKLNKNGYKFEMGKLPTRLLNMIHLFVRLHKKSLEEDENRRSTLFFNKKNQDNLENK